MRRGRLSRAVRRGPRREESVEKSAIGGKPKGRAPKGQHLPAFPQVNPQPAHVRSPSLIWSLCAEPLGKQARFAHFSYKNVTLGEKATKAPLKWLYC